MILKKKKRDGYRSSCSSSLFVAASSPFGPGCDVAVNWVKLFFFYNKILIVLPRLTCCKNGRKVLEPTPIPIEADEVKLEVLDLNRLLKGEVEEGDRFTAKSWVVQMIM